MKKSNINFTVELDGNNIPDRIYWDATDNPNEGLSDTKAISVAIWDHYHRGTLRLDLWTKDMEVGDMKRFYIEVMGGISNYILDATGDKAMSDDIDQLCAKLSKRVSEEFKTEKRN